MAYADIVATAQERQEYQDMLRILELLRKNQESELIGQEAAEYLALEARLEASGAFNRLLTQDASGQIVIRPAVVQRMSGQSAGITTQPATSPTDITGQTGTPQGENIWGDYIPPPGQPPAPTDLSTQPPAAPPDLRQQALDILNRKLKTGDMYEFPWPQYIQLLKEPTAEKGQFRFSRSGTPGYVVKWKVDPVSGDETFVDIVPSSDELKDIDAKPSMRYQKDESGQWYQYEVDKDGNIIENTLRPFGAAPKPKETPYPGPVTPAQAKFLEWYEEKYGEKTLGDKIRLGLAIPETRGRDRGYLDLTTNLFIKTGETEPEPKFTGGRVTKPTGKVDPYGNEWVQDYEIDKWSGKEMPVGNPYPRYTEAPAGLVGYRGPRGQVMSAMDVERMRASMENAPSDNISPGSIAARSGVHAPELVNIPGVSPGDWQALMNAQREQQAVGSAMGGLTNEKYLQGTIQNAVSQWPFLGLPQQAKLMDELKGQGVSFPGQPQTVSFGYGTTVPAPQFPYEELQNKPPTWLQAATRWR